MLYEQVGRSKGAGAREKGMRKEEVGCSRIGPVESSSSWLGKKRGWGGV